MNETSNGKPAKTVMQTIMVKGKPILHARFASEVLERADALIPWVIKLRGGVGGTRAGVLREAVMRGIEVLEREAGIEPAGGGGQS